MAVYTVTFTAPTIHDFGGSPRDLYQVQNPAPGDPDLAARVRNLLTPVQVRRDDRWGLDHGSWSILRHIYPQADIPVVQLSIDETRPPSFHYEVDAIPSVFPKRSPRCPIADTVSSLLQSTRAHAAFAMRPSGEQVPRMCFISVKGPGNTMH